MVIRISLNKLRKRDYIISFFVLLILLTIQLMEPELVDILKAIIATLVSSLIIGTITNLLLKKTK
ncbi:hypothetical protein [Caldisalinibacter kiritimatiensis]|uniref:Uncharacterized protein n=1 Tax=Caldisalinibacter kiritimatiensis TaxID=1304284 RepID=R1AV06_9FIRM|nr:hypothetical protein [Caldisalinibacter kiritimatiensis]EOD00462.1 hypothetical protein L21TH_1492 [Caldisalinibacter kiritimatiensis]